MKILIIGGTQFLGRHYVETAQKLGHEVTLFHRGKTNPDLFPELEHVHGDRDGEISKLGDRRWDVVVDPSGYVPRVIKQSVDYLKDRCKYYIFISSLSVYPDHEPNSDETAPLAVLEEPGSEEVMKHYGALKAECEKAVQDGFGVNSQIVRAGMIVGPYDKIDRLSYWLRRIDVGGEVLAPGDPQAPVQIIDARDIAEWSLRLAEESIGGVYNVTGPKPPHSMEMLLETIVHQLNPSARLHWVDSDFLVSKEIGIVDGLPYWVTPDYYGFFQRNVDRAITTGLTFRPLAETIQDTWQELKTRDGEQRSLSRKPTQEEEAAMLAEYSNEKSHSV